MRLHDLLVPASCPGVAQNLLDPRQSWNDPVAYDKKAQELAKRCDGEYKKYSKA